MGSPYEPPELISDEDIETAHTVLRWYKNLLKTKYRQDDQTRLSILAMEDGINYLPDCLRQIKEDLSHE